MEDVGPDAAAETGPVISAGSGKLGVDPLGVGAPPPAEVGVGTPAPSQRIPVMTLTTAVAADVAAPVAALVAPEAALVAPSTTEPMSLTFLFVT